MERTSTHVDKKEQATDDRQCLEEIVPGDAKELAKDNKRRGGSRHPLEEIALGMSGVDSPPVVDQNVEDGEENDEECRGPSCFEAHGDHDAGGETHDRHDDTCKGPLALEDHTDEEEYEKHAARQLKAVT